MAYVGKNPNFSTAILDNQGVSSVDNAPTGKVRLINRNNSLIAQDDTGAETIIGAPFLEPINYHSNGNFESSISTGVTTGGTAPTLSAETTTPLFDLQSLKITSAAGGCNVDFALSTIDNAVIDASVDLIVTAYFKTDSAITLGDYTVGVYNTTDTAYATTQTDLPVNDTTIHRTQFTPITGKTYVLRVEFTDTTAGRELIVDNLQMVPQYNVGIGPATSTIDGLVQKSTVTEVVLDNNDGPHTVDVSAKTLTGMTIAVTNGRIYRVAAHFMASFDYASGARATASWGIRQASGTYIFSSQMGFQPVAGQDHAGGHVRTQSMSRVWTATATENLEMRFSLDVNTTADGVTVIGDNGADSPDGAATIPHTYFYVEDITGSAE